MEALGAALEVEYRAVLEAGFDLQIDAPDLAMERHMTYAERPLGEFVGFVETTVAVINRALEGAPRERVRLHVCWGNYNGPHNRDVPLAAILPSLNKAKVGALLLSMANPRHAHEIACFEAPDSLPPHFSLILGLVDVTTNYVEHPAAVADRLVRAARTIGDPRRLMAATDCGFETDGGGGGFVHQDLVWAKLRALSRGAKLASSALFEAGLPKAIAAPYRSPLELTAVLMEEEEGEVAARGPGSAAAAVAPSPISARL